MSAKGKASRFRGVIALVLGILGSFVAAAAAVAAILFMFGANNAVDGIVERVTAPIDRLDQRVVDASMAVDSGDSGEVRARISGVADQADSVQAGLDTITEHAIYSQLPIDTDSLEARVQEIVDQAQSIEPIETGDLSSGERTRINGALTEVNDTLSNIDGTVRDTADSLRFWIRLSGILLTLLALWALWGQLLLARQGRCWMKA